MKFDFTELVIGVIVLVFSMFPTQVFSLAVAQWITLICGLILILHSFAEKKIGQYMKGVDTVYGGKPRTIAAKKKSSRLKSKRAGRK